MNKIATVFLLVMGLVFSLAAQDTTRVIYRIEMTNGNVFTGPIMEESDVQLVLVDQQIGQITLSKSDIKRRTDLSGITQVEGEYWFINPQASRYFWSPTGYGLEKGTGYYQNVWILFNQVVYGVSERVHIGGGLMPLFLFGGAPTPVWITAKYSQPLEGKKVSFGAGGLAGTVVSEFESFGIFYGIATIGDRDRNASVGLGWGFTDYGLAERPAVNFNFLIRTGPKGYFLSENYYMYDGFDNIVLITVGGRYIFNGGAALDYGLVMPFAGYDVFIAVPWLGLTFPLGGKE